MDKIGRWTKFDNVDKIKLDIFCDIFKSFYWWSRDFLPHFIRSGTISKALSIVVVGVFLSSKASGSDFKDLVFFPKLFGDNPP